MYILLRHHLLLSLIPKELSLSLLPLALVTFAALTLGLRNKSEKVVNWCLWAIWGSILLFAGYLVGIGLSEPFTVTFAWFDFGRSLNVTYGLDHPSTLMLALVLAVTFLVSLYSTYYMKGEDGYARYFASLFLFAASMLGIVLSFNLLLTFVCWELVGFCSYLLINFWYQRPSANEAARKAFVVNRIGDLGFVMALGLIYAQFESFELADIKNAIEAGNYNATWLSLAGFGILFGCVGKSAQFPLLVWLPDAMQAPTPVSALLHAATMVAAGIFLMARVMPILSSDVLVVAAYIGAVTSFIGAFSAACQTDIKKILAYSTVSQLGYMMAGLGAHSPFAALFHLFTHATFKATLFLGAGAIIHAMAHLRHSSSMSEFDPQDIRLMGGLRKKMPITFVAFTLATLAGSGVPGSAGFLSKDEIMAATCSWASLQPNTIHWLLPLLVFATSFMTAYYMGRMYFLVFFGGFRLGNNHSEYRGFSQHLHEAPLRMWLAYGFLSLFSVFLFFSIHPFDPDKSWLVHFLPKSTSAYGVEASFIQSLQRQNERLHLYVIAASVTVLSLGFLFSGLLYGFKTKLRHEFLRQKLSPNGLVLLSVNGLYLNTFYSNWVVMPFERISIVCSRFDRKYIDKAVELIGVFVVFSSHFLAWLDRTIVDGLVNGTVALVAFTGKQFRFLHNGKVQSYLVIGIAIMFVTLIWVMLRS